MKKRRSFEFSKILMIALIISFSFLIAGIVGININKDLGNSIFVNAVEKDGNLDDQNYVYKNWTENAAEWNDYEVQTEVIPSTSLTVINGVRQINSLEDWLYATATNTMSLSATYSINCDIVLNDGYFDDDGTYHDGGDGVCYVSHPFFGNYITVNGNNHTIKGFYIDDSIMSEEMITEKGGRYLCIFKPNNISTFKNIKIENVYLHGNKNDGMYGIFYWGANCSNIHVLSGVIKGHDSAFGICEYGSITDSTNRANVYGGTSGGNVTVTSLTNRATLKNCINYGNVDGGTGMITAGLSGNGCPSVTNCKNYGRISSNGRYTLGIGLRSAIEKSENYGELVGAEDVCGIAIQGSRIIDCKNYGKLTSTSTYSAHVVAGIGQAGIIKNCVNYGEISSPAAIAVGIHAGTYVSNSVTDCINYGKITSEAGQAAGITGTLSHNISNCVNYGEISGAIVGGISSEGKIKVIKNCSNYGTLTASGTIGGLVGSIGISNYDIVFKDCVSDCIFKGTATKAGGFVGAVTKSKSLIIENTKALIKEELNGEFGFVIGQLGTSTTVNDNILIKNCDIKTVANEQGLNYLIITNSVGKISFDGVVVEETNGETNTLLIKSSTGEEKFKSMIINTVNFKQSYGANFTSYYWKWKTGDIGIKTIDGGGLFQGELNREYLENKGYEIKNNDLNPDDNVKETYTQLLYIEATGSQYISTGYIPTKYTGFELDFQYTKGQSKNQSILFSGTSGDTSTYFGFNPYWWTSPLILGTYKYALNNSTSRQKIAFNVNSQIVINDEIKETLSRGDLTLNPSSKGISIFATTFSNNTDIYRTAAKVYALKIYEQDKKVLDFIPVKRDSDGAIGLLDRIEGKFYGNAGGGNFIAGSEA